MCERTLVHCQHLALPYTHSQPGLNSNRRHLQEPGSPRMRYAKSSSRAETAGTLQPSPTIRRSSQTVTSGQDCEAVRLSPTHQLTNRLSVASSPTDCLTTHQRTVFHQLTNRLPVASSPTVTKLSRKTVLPSFL